MPPEKLCSREQEILTETRVKCCECEELFKESDIEEIKGDLYCEDCRNDKFIICEECNEFHDIDDSIEVKNEWYCSIRCANEHGYHQCDDCGTWTNEEYSNHDSYICERCADNYGSCSDCGDIHNNDDLYWNDNEQCYYCDDCNDNSSRSGFIKYYSYRPKAYVFDKMLWENTLYLGIELEVECKDNHYPSSKAEELTGWLVKNKLDNRVYIKDDGSLDNGFEIVIHPTTLQAFHKRFPIKKFLSALTKMGLSSHESGTCGLHVHLSKKKMTDRDLWAGKLFFFKCFSQLTAFSMRNKLDFCKFDEEMPENGHDQVHGKYSAFNSCASTDTAEIRVFRGTLNYDRFIASLQFSDCFGEYIQETSVVYLKSKASTIIWDEFLKYAKKSKKYSQFIKYINKKGIK